LSHLAPPPAWKIRALITITLVKHPSSEKVTSRFRDSLHARLGLIDATGGRNVSAVPNFQATACFYSQNTATVDFVAEKFCARSAKNRGGGRKVFAP
jgi:hypothetical protein